MRVLGRIAAEDVAPQRWRNGGGWTRELLTWPPPPAAWQLRISLATIDAAGPFSVFPGVQRSLALVSGAGLLLNIDGHLQHLYPGADPVHFAGTAAVQAEPLAGPSVDLNLMSSAGHGALLRTTNLGTWSSPCPQRGLYSCVAGTLHAGGNSLAVAPDSLIWLAEAAGQPLRFAPAAPAPAVTAAWWLGYTPA